MGIKGLMPLIRSDAPNSFKLIKKSSTKNAVKQPYNGKIIAIDASIFLYQFLVQIRIDGKDDSHHLTDLDGNITSHIQGFLMRTTNFLEQGITPIYVFDGKPPDLKSDTLQKRKELKDKFKQNVENAKLIVENAKESDNEDSQEIIDAKKTISLESKRFVSVTREHIQDIKTLLSFMGVIYIDAPQEAEAQCAELVSSGICYAMASEDMDSLAFGANILLRGLNGSIKDPIIEINLNLIIKELKLKNHDSFIDLCILCGSDYCPNIYGIGPKTALKYILKYETIENIISNLKEKLTIPYNYMDLVNKSRNLFKNHSVIPGLNINISKRKLDEKGLCDFLISKNFNQEKILTLIKRINENNNSSKKSLKDFIKN